MTCPSCKASDFNETLESRPYVGLPSVTMHGVPVLRCAACGAVFRQAQAPAQAAELIARALIRKPRRLDPSEFRFLRKRVCKKALDFAALVSATPETLSRWENGKQAISPAYDRLLRLLAGRELADAFDVGLLSEIDDGDDAPTRLDLVHGEGGWQVVGSVTADPSAAAAL